VSFKEKCDLTGFYINILILFALNMDNDSNVIHIDNVRVVIHIDNNNSLFMIIATEKVSPCSGRYL